MPTAKAIAKQMENTKEEIIQQQNLLKELTQKYKVQEGKERKDRHLERGALLESLIEDAESFTDEQIKLFLEKTIQTNFAFKVLTQFKEENVVEVNAKQSAQQSENGEKHETTGETKD